MDEQFQNILLLIAQFMVILALPAYSVIVKVRHLLRIKNASLEEARGVLEARGEYPDSTMLWVLVVMNIVFFFALLYPEPMTIEVAIVLGINVVVLPHAIYPWAARYLAKQRMQALEFTSAYYEQSNTKIE